MKNVRGMCCLSCPGAAVFEELDEGTLAAAHYCSVWMVKECGVRLAIA